MDRGAWWAAVLGVAKTRTRLSDFTFTLHFHALEKEMAIHSRVLAWRIPGTGEPGGLPSMGLHRVGHDWSGLAAEAAPTATTPVRREQTCLQFLRRLEFSSSVPLLVLPTLGEMNGEIQWDYWRSWQCEQRDNSILFLGSIIVLIFYLGCRTNMT